MGEEQEAQLREAAPPPLMLPAQQRKEVLSKRTLGDYMVRKCTRLGPYHFGCPSRRRSRLLLAERPVV